MIQVRKKQVIYCQFCKNYYYPNIFRKHLQICSNYIRYVYQNRKQIEWKPKVERNISYTSNPEIFYNLLRDKRVIIVGPSITVQKCGLGNLIDGFDIIVRLNKSVPLPKHMYNHIGSRTDVIYNSLNTSDYPGENKFSPHFLKKHNIKYLRCPYPPISPFKNDIRNFCKKNRNMINFGHIDIE